MGRSSLEQNQWRDKVRGDLLDRMESLAKHLCPAKGRVDGKNYFCENPHHAEKNPNSFCIQIKGAAKGRWNDFSGGDKGDVFGLIAFVQGWRLPADFPKVMDWAERWLGISADKPAPVRRRDTSNDTAYVDQGDAAKAAKARAWWFKCHPDILDTPVEVYFEGRNTPLRELPRLPGALRYQSDLRYYYGAGKYREMPGIVAAANDDAGKIKSIHRTYLRPDGRGKANVPSPKRVYGPFKGCKIPLARGRSGLSPRLAAERGEFSPLAIVEGIEDGLTIALARPDWRVWAAISLGNIQNLLWPDCAEEVILIADNDEDLQARDMFNRAVDAWSLQGGNLPLRVARPPAGIKDFNDWLRTGL